MDKTIQWALLGVAAFIAYQIWRSNQASQQATQSAQAQTAPVIAAAQQAIANL